MSQRITFSVVLILALFLLIAMVSSIARGVPKEGVDFVWVDLGKENDEHGLSQTDAGANDGAFEVDKKDGVDCRKSPVGDIIYYMYFQIDDNFVFGGNNEAWIVIEYFDTNEPSETGVDCQYDSNGEGDVQGAYSGAKFGSFPFLELEGTKTWRFHIWHITDGRFENRQKASGDFRLCRRNGPLWLNRVWVSLIKPPDSFNPTSNESWPMDVEPSMKLASTWGALKR